MVGADREVDDVVPGRHLERARPEPELDALVGDHRHAPQDERDDHLLADRVAVALVVRVHGHGDVGEDRRRSHRRDREARPAVRKRPVGERIARVGQGVVDLDVLDLEVGDRRLVEGAPVDEPVRAIDPAALPEMDEEAHHGLDVRVVHREPLAAVVERGAEPAELAHDRLPGRVEVLPDALDERLAPELLARRALEHELLLDHVLGRDSGVVVTGLPERVEPPQPMPADQQILDRPVERVAEVERAGDVRRRHADHEGLVVSRSGTCGVQPLLLPEALPALFDAVRLVERLHHSMVGQPIGSGVRQRLSQNREAQRRIKHVVSRARAACPRRRRACPRRSRPASRGGSPSPRSGRDPYRPSSAGRSWSSSRGSCSGRRPRGIE